MGFAFGLNGGSESAAPWGTSFPLQFVSIRVHSWFGMNWEVVSSTVEFEDDHLTVTRDEVRTPGRSDQQEWIVAHRKRAVGIAAMTADNKLLLIRQERIPIKSTIWEVPAGQIDDQGEVSMSAIEVGRAQGIAGGDRL